MKSIIWVEDDSVKHLESVLIEVSASTRKRFQTSKEIYETLRHAHYFVLVPCCTIITSDLRSCS